MHFRLGKKVFRVNIPLEGLWYFDELVTVNSTAALDVKVVIKKCIMSMIRAALNIIQCTIWGQLIKDTKIVIASHAHTITIPH